MSIGAIYLCQLTQYELCQFTQIELCELTQLKCRFIIFNYLLLTFLHHLSFTKHNILSDEVEDAPHLEQRVSSPNANVATYRVDPNLLPAQPPVQTPNPADVLLPNPTALETDAAALETHPTGTHVEFGE